MAGHRAACADLAARALEPSIFNDPAFAMPAAVHLATHRRPRFLAAWDPRDPSRLIGLCCVAAPVPGVPLSAWLHPQATAAFPLLDAEQALTAMADLLAQTAGRLRPAGLLMHGVPLDGATMRLIAAQPLWSVATMARRSRAVVRDAPEPLCGKAGKEFRRQARRMADAGRVAVTSAATPTALDDFLHLEARGWKGRRATALATTPRLAGFARSVMAPLVMEGRCRIYSLTLNDQPIAMGLVLRCGPHAFFWKTAFDEAFARFSPGAHLAAAIGQAQSKEFGIALTDSCAVPGHSMIDRLWPERMIVTDVFILPAPELSILHRIVLRIARAGGIAKAAAKHALAAFRKRRRRLGHIPNMSEP